MKNTEKLNKEQIKRIKTAIMQTQAIIAKEMGYSEDLRNKRTIYFESEHLEMLKGMLVA